LKLKKAVVKFSGSEAYHITPPPQQPTRMADDSEDDSYQWAGSDLFASEEEFWARRPARRRHPALFLSNSKIPE